MTSIKKQISDLRKTTPKHIQWLLLAAAFIVVLILLTLLLSGKSKKETKIANADDVPVNLIFAPTQDSVNWAETPVGTTKTQSVKISASAPAKVLAVRRTKDIPGLSDQQTCTRMGQIDKNASCTIVLEYKPTTAMNPETTALFIDWRAANEPDEMKKTDKIILVLGAQAPATTPQKPTPTAPVVAPVIEPAPVAPKPIREEIRQEIELISSSESDPFAKKSAPAQPATEQIVVNDTITSDTPAEACSDFAFPGYNLSGVQIGWIRPERGAYYFHPFADKDCDSPTGMYNPDNGIITDINDKAKKIGTDAEHIGYTAITNGTLPQLSNPTGTKSVNRAFQLTTEEIVGGAATAPSGSGFGRVALQPSRIDPKTYLGSAMGETVVSSMPYDRSFILRQYKPIPATIVSEILADAEALKTGLPVRATVDRNVYSDNGRTVILPTGTLMLGYVTGTLPGPYTTVGRMDIKWYQFIRPDGVEFNFGGNNPFSADSQGRSGVPGRGSTDYVEQFIMPMLTAIVPAAVNLIAPISDTFINQIDLDNNTVVQSGTVRSSELAKNEIITAWNQVAQKLLVDMMDNTVPPFSIAAGTRITVYSPVDLLVTCGSPNDPENAGKKCAISEYSSTPRASHLSDATPNYEDGSWTGQVRSFNLTQYCTQDNKGVWGIKANQEAAINNAGYDYRTVLMYCQSMNYQAINNAKQDAVYQNQQQQFQNNYNVSQSGTGLTGIAGDQKYNQEVLGLTYNEDGSIQNPFAGAEKQEEQAATIITCEDGTNPDANGCCTGEIYTDMGDQGFNCCPETGGDCFPPIL